MWSAERGGTNTNELPSWERARLPRHQFSISLKALSGASIPTLQHEEIRFNWGDKKKKKSNEIHLLISILDFH